MVGLGARAPRRHRTAAARDRRSLRLRVSRRRPARLCNQPDRVAPGRQHPGRRLDTLGAGSTHRAHLAAHRRHPERKADSHLVRHCRRAQHRPAEHHRRRGHDADRRGDAAFHRRGRSSRECVRHRARLGRGLGHERRWSSEPAGWRPQLAHGELHRGVGDGPRVSLHDLGDADAPACGDRGDGFHPLYDVGVPA